MYILWDLNSKRNRTPYFENSIALNWPKGLQILPFASNSKRIAVDKFRKCLIYFASSCAVIHNFFFNVFIPFHLQCFFPRPRQRFSYFQNGFSILLSYTLFSFCWISRCSFRCTSGNNRSSSYSCWYRHSCYISL